MVIAGATHTRDTMPEWIKAIAAIAMIFAAVAAFGCWVVEVKAVTPVVWALRIGLTCAALGSFTLLLWSCLRKDKVPDFLRPIVKRPFEQSGFTFAIVPSVRDATCVLDIYYQNRFARGCQATVVLQPARGFFLTKADLAALSIPIDCPGGGFGVVRVPWGIPIHLHGTRQTLDVAARVRYPHGQGALLRFRDGLVVGSAKADWHSALTVGALLTGALVLSRPAKFQLTLPVDVQEFVPSDAPINAETLWVPGDPVPAAAADAREAVEGG